MNQRQRYQKSKEKNTEHNELIEEDFALFFYVLNDMGNVEQHEEPRDLTTGIFCEDCSSEDSLIKTTEGYVCGECGYVYGVAMELNESEEYERYIQKKQFYSSMEYFHKKFRQIQGIQNATLSFKIASVKTECKVKTLQGVIDWLKRKNLLSKHRRHAHRILYLAFGIRIRFPEELLADLQLMYSRFLEFYYNYKTNKKKIIPFNYIIREFISIICLIRNRQDWIIYLFYFKSQKDKRNHFKNIELFKEFKEDLKKEYQKTISK